MNSELDAQVAAEVMQWRLIDWDQKPLCDPNGEPVEGGPTWITQSGNRTGRYTWNWLPSEDLSAAFEMEAEIERQGLKVEYVKALIDLIQGSRVMVMTFELIHATPDQRCRAALVAVRGQA